MISDLTSLNGATPEVRPDTEVVPPARGSAMVLAAFDRINGAVQPVRDVQAYLKTRSAREDVETEKHLLITLPAKLQTEVKALVRACQCVRDLVKEKFSVQAACKQTLAIFAKWNWKLGTFRQKFDLWMIKRDWIVLVNMAKAPAAWRAESASLPEAFLQLCEIRFGQFGRDDGKRQALLSLHRQWRTGRNDHGQEEVIAGYDVQADGTLWRNRNREILPTGWSYTNITRQLKKRARFTKATRAMIQEGASAAREFLPQMLGTRRHLRFLEKVTFDDVRMDWLVFNPTTGNAEELWLLVARDEATALALGFVMHPATVREDGKASHLGARQMKELAAYLLERFPLPPYLVHWVVERGTATLAEGVQAALAELFNERIKVHYTSMIGGASPVGYAEKRKGNSRGKASHEAHNRITHTAASFIMGQTGANWSIRPADLEARIKECKSIHEFAQSLPAEKRGEVKYPLLTLAQARGYLEQIFHNQNCRREHALEGFESILVEEGGRVIQRMEMPVERAMRLMAAVPAEQWTRCSPEIIKTFLEHTERPVTVEANGEIEFLFNKERIYFRNSGNPLPPGTKALAYHHPEDPQFLHLTSGDGRILGTWCQRGRGSYLDQQALAEAMRYTHAARTAAETTAAELTAPQREQLDAIRAHNEALKQFVVTTETPEAGGYLTGSAVSAALASLEKTGQAMKTNPPTVEPEPDCTEEFLTRPAEPGINQ